MSEKVAILVIHGMGQQKPYETLDSFTRNLMESLGNSGPSWVIRPQLDQVADPVRNSKSWTRASFRITPPDPANPPSFTSDPKSSISEISLFEYYWAPITQDKVTYSGSLTFLIKAGLQPFLYLASNVTAISKAQEQSAVRKGAALDAAKEEGRSAAGKRVPFILIKEFWRQACLFVPLLLLFVALLFWLKEATFENLAKLTRINWTLVALLILLAIRYLYLYSSVQTLFQSLKSKGGWQTSFIWRSLLAGGILFHIFALPLFLSPLLHLSVNIGIRLAHYCPFLPALLGHWAAHVNHFADRIHFPYGTGFKHQLAAVLFFDPSLARYSGQLVTALLALFVRFILIDYVGDVAVYANTSQFSKSYAVRSQIIDECSAAVSEILRSTTPKYDRVLIAAHSLGSVIAYDTMNNLLDMARSSTAVGSLQPQQLASLRGLITFGCPLNKIYYFFREQDDPKLALRDQTLDLLYGFRSAIPAEVDSSLAFRYDEVPGSWFKAEEELKKGFRWINAYSLGDPISGRIVFYKVDSQKRFEYPWPFFAHISYWEDPRFYDFFRGELL